MINDSLDYGRILIVDRFENLAIDSDEELLMLRVAIPNGIFAERLWLSRKSILVKYFSISPILRGVRLS